MFGMMKKGPGPPIPSRLKLRDVRQCRCLEQGAGMRDGHARRDVEFVAYATSPLADRYNPDSLTTK